MFEPTFNALSIVLAHALHLPCALAHEGILAGARSKKLHSAPPCADKSHTENIAFYTLAYVPRLGLTTTGNPGLQAMGSWA
jgi:hypothetical protein